MNVLVIAAHPDDEILGCGATMARHVEREDIVDVLIIGDGVTSRYKEDEIKSEKVLQEVEKIKQDAIEASKVIGVNSIEIKGFNCCRFDKLYLLDITKLIEEKIRKCKPDRIYTHGPYDANNDHTIIFKAVQIATRPMPEYSVKEVLLMEILSGTEWGFYRSFKPNIYLNVEKTIEKKIQAIKKFKGEIRKFPHPRSIESIEILAKKRGSEAGLVSAEAFELLRAIE